MILSDRKDIPREWPMLKRDTLTQLVNVLMSDVALRENMFRTCLSCMNWQHETEVCELFQQRPPARIIANGCDKYVDIPF